MTTAQRPDRARVFLLLFLFLEMAGKLEEEEEEEEEKEEEAARNDGPYRPEAACFEL